MDRLREMEVFVAVAEAGSLAKAGTHLRMSPPAVTRAVSALESRLGARVFNRTTRGLTITEVGQRFLESARRVLADLEAAEREAVGESSAPQGHLTVTAPVTLGRALLAPIVGSFLSEHPRITASVYLVDRVVNLVEEGIDIAVRIGELPDSNLVARSVGVVRRVLVASPRYLEQRGLPTSPKDLKLHSLIAFTGLVRNREWRFGAGGRSSGVVLSPTFEINDAAAAIHAAQMGHGITVALSYMVQDGIRDGRLVSVLDDWISEVDPVNLVFLQSRLIAPKVRAFVDFVTPSLTKMLNDLAA